MTFINLAENKIKRSVSNSNCSFSAYPDLVVPQIDPIGVTLKPCVFQENPWVLQPQRGIGREKYNFEHVNQQHLDDEINNVDKDKKIKTLGDLNEVKVESNSSTSSSSTSKPDSAYSSDNKAKTPIMTEEIKLQNSISEGNLLPPKELSESSSSSNVKKDSKAEKATDKPKVNKRKSFKKIIGSYFHSNAGKNIQTKQTEQEPKSQKELCDRCNQIVAKNYAIDGSVEWSQIDENFILKRRTPNAGLGKLIES